MTSEATDILMIQKKLLDNLKTIYPEALAADESLEALKNEDKGKFIAIFQPSSGFEATSNRFLPYLIELSEDVTSLPDLPAEKQSSYLQFILNKIKAMHQLLNAFQTLGAASKEAP